MKDLEEIKECVAKERDFNSWYDLVRYWDLENVHVLVTITDEVARRYATEYAKEVQKNCAENVKAEKVSNGFNEFYLINRQSILSEDNLPKH